MSKTVLITGSSSGIGKATVLYFAEKGWQVAATMRSPKKFTEFENFPNIKLYQLDVTETKTIEDSIKKVIADFGRIDVIVNNAGYGAVGIFEKATQEQIDREFKTNVFGVMNMIRSILPHFRKNKAGIIINITSMGGLITFPAYSIYHATKWAVEGFAESLSYELKALNIKIKNIEPGAIKTDFYSRSMETFKNDQITDYDRYEQMAKANMDGVSVSAPGPKVVAKTIFKAATDNSWKLRYPTGGNGPLLLLLNKILPFAIFRKLISSVLEKGQ